jgi:hypothetical protein
MKIKKVKNNSFMYFCPGCGNYHTVVIKPNVNQSGASWDWNKSFSQPTFTPSILEKIEFTGGRKTPIICHHFVREGKIEYLTDCTHFKKGQNVEMVDIRNEP